MKKFTHHEQKMQSGNLLREKMQMLSTLRGGDLCVLVKHISDLDTNDLVNIPKDYEPWLYEYAVFIHATAIAQNLIEYISTSYCQTAVDQKSDFDNAIKLCISQYWQFRYFEGNLVDLLVRMYELNSSMLKVFFKGSKHNGWLYSSSIYLEFILRTNQKADEYINYANVFESDMFKDDKINLEDYIIFLRNYHTLIAYQNNGWWSRIINVYDYVNYLGTKAITGCIELIAQINESGQLESGDIVISKASITELVNSKEYQMLVSGKLKPEFKLIY